MEGSVVVLLFLLLGVCWASHPKPSCRYPPSEWCRSLEIATACKVQKQCMEKNAIRQEPSAPKVEVVLYYESLCPYSIRYYTQILYPTYMLLNEIMELRLIPYGNTRESGSANKPFICQHGQKECDLNIIEGCVLHYLSDTDFKFEIINCIESAIDKEKSVECCFKVFSYYVPWDDIFDCAHGPEGIALMHTFANQTKVLDPPLMYVPWITINKEHTMETDEASWTSLFLLVCHLYKGAKPSICTGIPTQLNRGYSFA